MHGLPDVIVSDGGPPYNSYAFVNFLEKQGIKVFKSPPYNPPSNGQAERLVRTVKDVLKKFLIDSELAHLNLEDQINLFLINYRNTCVAKDESFPAEKIFTYKPKTLVDLLNPKNHYKKQLVQKDNDEIVHSSDKGCGPKGSVDPLDALSEGTELWYRNNNPHNNLRWIKAFFIKKYSTNVFQIQIGSAVLLAHRNQLRACKNVGELPRPNIFVQQESRNKSDEGAVSLDKRGASLVSIPSDEGSVPQSNEARVDQAEASASSNSQSIHPRKRKRQASVSVLNSTPRRSKRKRVVKIDSNFVYT